MSLYTPPTGVGQVIHLIVATLSKAWQMLR